MKLSVVVPTLNEREQLAACLDALQKHAPGAEVIVVNGPSADGTTGMVKERTDVDVLIEIADRNRNVARNAGAKAATGETIAFLGANCVITDTWLSAIETYTAEASDIITGPVHGSADHAQKPASGGPSDIDWSAGNLVMRRSVLEQIGDFDEQLGTGGIADMLSRARTQGISVDWAPSMEVSIPYGTDGGTEEMNRYQRYRSFAYRKLKHNGLHPVAIGAILLEALRDAGQAAIGIVQGDINPSGWFASGKRVLRGLASGAKAGLTTRYHTDGAEIEAEPTADTVIEEYDWRENR